LFFDSVQFFGTKIFFSLLKSIMKTYSPFLLMIIFAYIVRELQATTTPIIPNYNKGVRSRQYVEEVNKGLSKALKAKDFRKFNRDFKYFLAAIKEDSKRHKSQSEQQMRRKINENLRQKINEMQIELEPSLMSTNLQEADRRSLSVLKKNLKEAKRRLQEADRLRLSVLRKNLKEAKRRILSVLKNFRKFLDGSAFNALPPSDSQIDSEENDEQIVLKNFRKFLDGSAFNALPPSDSQIDSEKNYEIRKKVGNWSWGTRTYDNGDSYEGNLENGKKHGWGAQTYDNGDEYRGNWENGKRHGYGTQTYGNGDSYTGNWENGKRHGYGTETYDNGDEYRGNWENDKRHGYGTQTYDNGDEYRGNWENDKRHGWGTQTYDNGDSYEGNWKNGKRDG
jgi:hypothetical protein